MVENKNYLQRQSVDRARSSGKPTLVEFGATGCVPCDMMQPVLENLRKKYQKAQYVFVHVGENRFLVPAMNILIPVQAFLIIQQECSDTRVSSLRPKLRKID